MLSVDFDPSARRDNLQTFVAAGEAHAAELQALLLQVFAITDALRRHCQMPPRESLAAEVEDARTKREAEIRCEIYAQFHEDVAGEAERL
jgi:hypothetical protein